MSGGGDGEEPMNHERWIVSYADFITLLFATFAALYAITVSVDAQKASLFEQSVRDALDSTLSEKLTWIPPSASRRVPTLEATTSRSVGGSLVKSQEQCVGGPGASSAGTDGKSGDEKKNPRWFRKMSEDLERLAQDPALEGKVEVKKLSENEVMVRMADAGTFNSGDSTLSPQALEIIEVLSKKMEEFRRVDVQVEGHTDNIPMSGGRFPSNWELSSARSASVVQAFQQFGGIDPARMVASGHGEFRPVADNTNSDGRAKNRRVDIIIRPGGRVAPSSLAAEPLAPADVQAGRHWEELPPEELPTSETPRPRGLLAPGPGPGPGVPGTP